MHFRQPGHTLYLELQYRFPEHQRRGTGFPYDQCLCRSRRKNFAVGRCKGGINDEATFEFAPELGYRIENIRVDDIDLGALTTYTFKNNYRNHSITAFFKAAYAVTDAVYDRKTNSLSVELINESRIKAVCAVYDSEGTMAGAAALSVKAKMGEFTMPLSGIQVPETGTIRVMILDSKWIPLCRSYTITY